MKGNVMMQLVWKDWRLQQLTIILTIIAGAAALAILMTGREMQFVIGSVFFFVAIILCGCLLPMQNIVNERKKQNLAFIMSLPVSSAYYGAAKLVSTVAMFLAPWMILLGTGLYVILGRHMLPVGMIPMGLILMGFPLIGFCLTTGTALVSESEGWATATIVAANSSYWLVWITLVRHFPSLGTTWKGPVAVWSPAVFKILSAEFGIILLLLGLTLYIQSRKRNFI